MNICGNYIEATCCPLWQGVCSSLCIKNKILTQHDKFVRFCIELCNIIYFILSGVPSYQCSRSLQGEPWISGVPVPALCPPRSCSDRLPSWPLRSLGHAVTHSPAGNGLSWGGPFNLTGGPHLLPKTLDNAWSLGYYWEWAYCMMVSQRLIKYSFWPV